MTSTIKKKDSAAILNALQSGVVPNKGLHHILVGRELEVKQIFSELQSVKEGASMVKFFSGPFGCGKSFLQSIVYQTALKQNYVATKADFTPERRLYSIDGKAVALYTELVKNLSTPTCPDGNALPFILDKWVSEVQSKVIEDKDYSNVEYDNPDFVKDVQLEISKVVSKMDALTGGFDFARVLIQYFIGYVTDNSELQRYAMHWLRGEFTTKTEAKAALGVRDIIHDSNYYEYIKVLSQFVKEIGYSGLVINFDEAINLYKIAHPQTREKNYETILKIYNDTLQGTLDGIYITFGCTNEVIEDKRKGLYSYEALKTRLQPNEFTNSNMRDLSQPVIKLMPLAQEESFALLKKVRDIHAAHYDCREAVLDRDIEKYLSVEYSKLGAEENITTRGLLRGFVGILNILQQNSSARFSDVFNKQEITIKPNNAIQNRFK